MADPVVSPALVTVVATGSAGIPVLLLAGKMGLPTDILVAGLLGALAAMWLLDSVPSTGDTRREFFRTMLRRLGVGLGSMALAAFIAPVFGPIVHGVLAAITPEASAKSLTLDNVLRGTAFVLGGGAQQFLRLIIERGTRPLEAKA